VSGVRERDERKESGSEEGTASDGSETRYSLCADNTQNSGAVWGSSR
jgi:hypothetical protein